MTEPIAIVGLVSLSTVPHGQVLIRIVMPSSRWRKSGRVGGHLDDRDKYME